MKSRLLGVSLGVTLGLMAMLNLVFLSPVQARPLTTAVRPVAQRLQTPGIVNFTAKAATTRGQINLSWTYTGKALRNQFLVERSNNRSTWTSVATCRLYYSSKSTSYRCSDTKLTSSRTYYYRLCIPATGVKTCPKTSSAASAKAP